MKQKLLKELHEQGYLSIRLSNVYKIVLIGLKKIAKNTIIKWRKRC
jgi:hypothetical protein